MRRLLAVEATAPLQHELVEVTEWTLLQDEHVALGLVKVVEEVNDVRVALAVVQLLQGAHDGDLVAELVHVLDA